MYNHLCTTLTQHYVMIVLAVSTGKIVYQSSHSALVWVLQSVLLSAYSVPNEIVKNQMY